MSIQVHNASSQDIDVAINHWGKPGDCSYFCIKPLKTEVWDRSDVRGFVMSLNRNGHALPYYVNHNSNIKVTDDEVLDGGKIIKPLR